MTSKNIKNEKLWFIKAISQIKNSSVDIYYDDKQDLNSYAHVCPDVFVPDFQK